ncbi:MAG: ATP-binding cassette domain-containing protein [Bdellovibrionota bacterium]
MNIKNLSSQLSQDFQLKNISFNLHSGEILTLLGRSGSGKSSLLRCLAGLQNYQADICTIPRPLGMVFQSANLFAHLTLEENIKLALIKTQKKTNSEAQKICEQVLEQVQLSHRGKSKPHQLSGGEQQRGAIARTLALVPKVILYDEPTSALDPELVEEVFDLMLSLKKQGLTQIIVSHETRVVKKVSDFVGVMNQGELKWFGALADLKPQLHLMEPDEKKYLQIFT